MIPNPIRKVLSTMQKHQVQALLMGGQACVFYGAAEFSRDSDFAILAEAQNLNRLRSALDELQAQVIAVPPFSIEYLNRGHAIHFRCAHPDATGLRVDVMSIMRGVDSFPMLWARRTTLETDDGETYELLSLPDLVKAKKTQRDKDWPMIRRLVESHYFSNRGDATPVRIEFWLRELRTPALLQEVAARFPHETSVLQTQRETLLFLNDEKRLVQALREEEDLERQCDKEYWKPLRAELEQLRHSRRNQN